MNIVMNSHGGFIELQGTAEAAAFSDRELQDMLQLARGGIERIFEIQRRA